MFANTENSWMVKKSIEQQQKNTTTNIGMQHG